jgi:hypothetical protein
MCQLQPPLLLLLLCLQAHTKFLPPAVFQCDMSACVSSVVAAAAAAAAAAAVILVIAGAGQVLATRSVPVRQPRPYLCASTAAAAVGVSAGTGQVPATRSVPV